MFEHEVNYQNTVHSITIGPRRKQNPFTAEFTSMAEAMRRLTPQPRGRRVTVLTSKQGALHAVGKSKSQFGQAILCKKYRFSKAGQSRTISRVTVRKKR